MNRSTTPLVIRHARVLTMDDVRREWRITRGVVERFIA